jgi:hypothetical protein
MSADTPPLASLKQAYEPAYRRALYRVMLEDDEVTLTIGHYDAATEQQLCKTFDLQRHWVILTPCNPRSVQSRDELNNFYLDELRFALASRSGTWGKATNIDPRGGWPDEPGFFVVDPDLGWIMDLGRRFGQNALVYAALGQPPTLIWLT